MNDKQESSKLFVGILMNYFEKVKKNLPKKYASFKDFINKMGDLLKNESSTQISLGRYYVVFRLIINMKSQKLWEISLATITRLVSHNFIDGKQEDTSSEFQLDEFPELFEDLKNLKANQKIYLIDSLIYSIRQCLVDKEEIIVQSLKLLIALATNERSQAYGNTLVRIISTIMFVHTRNQHIYKKIESKSPQVDRISRTGLFQIINLTFQAVEEQDVSIFSNKRKRSIKGSLTEIHNQLPLNSTKDPSTTSPQQIVRSGSIKKVEGIDLFLTDLSNNSSIMSVSPGQQKFKQKQNRKQSLNQFINNPYTKLCSQILTQVVDDVQMYSAKVEKIIKDLSEDDRQIEIKKIPHRSVPYIFTSDNVQYQQIQVLNDQFNEMNIISGRFGWCIMCRQSANLYCKDHRVPICSYICKRQHVEFVDWAQRLHENTQKWRKLSLESALILFEALCKLLGNSSQLVNQKNQQISLEMVLQVVDYPDQALTQNKTFLKIVKEVLCSQLLKYCLETERTLFNLSFKIFLRLFFNLKKELKHEIGIFIDQIFLKILESNNSSFLHRQIALEVLMKMVEKKKIALEFYINFDCSMDHVCLLEKIINLLATIIDGMYTKPEFQAVITIQQEAQLRIMAVNTIILITNGLQDVFDEMNPYKDETVTSRRQMEEEEENEQNILKDLVNELEKQRSMKQEYQKGVELFNKSPEKGMKYLIKAQIINENPSDIVNFLKSNQNVTKDAVGQYLGMEAELNKSVLVEYTDQLSFKNMNVEMGLRHFLDQFTLKGASEAVDRIIQKFSQKYFQDNNLGPVKTSDSVYTFSYLLIMLQTDLHNPNVDEKMKFTDFTKLARGINDGEDLPQDYMQTIYSNIQKTPLAIHEKEKAQKGLQDSITQSMRKKQDLFLKESQQLIKKGNELIKTKAQSTYVKIDSVYYIKLLLEVIGNTLFSSLCQSFQMELPQEHFLINTIIKSITQILRLCSFFQIPLEQNMEKVVKLCNYQNGIFQDKQYHLIQQLLLLSPQIGGGFKQGGWKPLFQMISRLDEMKTSKGDDLMLQMDFDLIDKVFEKSKLLDAEAILEFISALCQVSKQELANPQNPRTYSLQKLVEVSDYNMDRIKIVWAKMWNVVRDHFSEVGTRAPNKIAIFAVDQLRQLSVKFLQKEELYSFQFQREFLRPFETIFLNVPLENEEIKEYILSCMHLIVLNYKSNIKSGWRVIFDLINYGLQEESDKISRTAFQILCRIMNHDLDMIQDVFVDLIQSLGKLGKKRQEDLALASIEFVRQCLNYLSGQAKILPKQNWGMEDEDIQQQEQNNEFTVSQLENNWVPLLGQLSTMAGDSRAAVQESAMDTLFNLLHQYGYAFSTEFWKIVFQVVLRPLFDEIQFTFQMRTNHKPGISEGSQKESHWFKNSCQKGFNHITNLVNQYFHKLRELLPDFLKLFENCIQNQNELLAKFALSAVKNTVMKLGIKFSDDEWSEVIEFCERMFKATTPSKLLQVSLQDLTENLLRKSKNKLKLNTEEAYTQCASQLLLIQVTKDLIEHFATKLSLRSLTRLDVCVSNSQAFAKEFNSSVELRYLLWQNGFMAEMKQLPGLLRQEREAQACTFTLKYQIYKKLEDPIKKENQLKEYKDELLDCVKQFIQKNKEFYQLGESKVDEIKEQQKSAKKQNSSSKNFTNNIEEDEEGTLNNEVRKLKIQEVEREAINFRTLLDQTILPKILQLENSELLSSVQEFHTTLLDSLQYTCERSFTQSTCLDCKYCERCQKIARNSLEPQFRCVLQRLFETVYNR